MMQITPRSTVELACTGKLSDMYIASYCIPLHCMHTRTTNGIKFLSIPNPIEPPKLHKCRARNLSVLFFHIHLESPTFNEQVKDWNHRGWCCDFACCSPSYYTSTRAYMPGGGGTYSIHRQQEDHPGSFERLCGGIFSLPSYSLHLQLEETH